jgi:hypothetical protein
MQIVGEIVQGSGTSFTLAYTPVTGYLALTGAGIRLTPAVDFTISGTAITFIGGNTYAAGQVLADYSTNVAPAGAGTDVLTPFALTTLQRVKDLLFAPNKTILVTGCTIVANSATVSGGTIPTGKTIVAGQQISGLGIVAGTTVASISGSTITLSLAATASNTGQTVTVIDQTPAYDAVLSRMINYATNYINNECGRFSFVQQTYVNDTYSIDNSRQRFLLLRNTPVFPATDGVHTTALQWRAGTPTNPQWTDFILDQYELVDPRTDPISGKVWYPSGEIRIYGALPSLYSNMIRVSYTGGYPVNWANPEDHNTHWLPGDLTSVCENLVVRRFKRRSLAGQSSMTLEGATVAGWRNVLDQEDMDVLGQYRDLHF